MRGQEAHRSVPNFLVRRAGGHPRQFRRRTQSDGGGAAFTYSYKRNPVQGCVGIRLADLFREE